MKRFVFLYIAVISVLCARAQTYTIHWEDNQTITYAQGKTVTLPSFNNEHFVFDQGQIYLQNSQKTTALQALSVSQMHWEKLPKNLWYDLQLHEVTPDEEADFNPESHTDTAGMFINYRIKAIKRINDEIYRLTSYTLTPQTPQVQTTAQQFKNLGNSADSPLATGTFYKIKVDKTGVFKITTAFLKENGIDPNSVNPKHLRIYGNGGLMLPEYNRDVYYSTLQENAIEVVGEDDEQWNDEDFALFYAQGPNGFGLYNRGHRRRETRTDRSYNVVNIYDESAYYFLSFDQGEGKRITTETNTPTNTFKREYDDYQYLNEEKNNLRGIGRLWVGDAFTNPQDITFNTPEPIPAQSETIYRARVATSNAQNAKISLSFNGEEASLTAGKNFGTLVFDFSTNNITGNTLKFNFTPDISPNPNALFYLDYVEVLYKQPLKFNGNLLAFRDFSISEGSGMVYGFEISNAGGIDRVWNVADVTNVRHKPNMSGNADTFQLSYLANSDLFNNEFIAFNMAAAQVPTFVGRIENQNLAALTDTDYLIITAPTLVGEAQRLASYHQEQNHFKVAIVEPEKIYNEYSSGGQDITAIRNFIAHLKNNGNLKYVLILGDTSYDYRGKISKNPYLIPSYESESSLSFDQSFVTDDYFVMSSPQRSSSLSNIFPDLPIGRLPAQNSSEAKTLIDKTLAYYNQLANQSTPFGDWKMNMDFVVDDDNDGGTPFHTEINAVLKNIFQDGTDKKEYHIRKLYLDAFAPESTAGGQRYPAVQQGINTAISNSLFLMYFGHGGVNGWAQERVLTVPDIQSFNNFSRTYSRFPLVSTITCEFTLWDNPAISSAGEIMMKHPQGGPATMITSSRELGVNYGKRFSRKFLEHLFQINANQNFNRLGDAFLSAKIAFGAHPDHLKVNFLGDPAMQLSRPQPHIIIDEIIKPTTNSIRALDFIKIKGHITTPQGSTDTDFNGKVIISLFDKFQNKSTRNNDGNLTPILHYKEEGNPIVKSSGTATAGEFELEFYIPKDIDFDMGDGRLLLYADNQKRDVYHSETVTIGGINPNGINDNEPPKIKLFMNNTNFADGGITNENPILLACLTDNMGINATGAGIGHDITMVLDGEVINTKVLNDYFSPGEGNGCISTQLKDFQKGTVNYAFQNLKPGNHQLVLKVWDINNNSASASLNFIVRPQGEENLVVKRLLNWPNPFTNKTYIHFEHNCPDLLEVTAQIYTITGKLVKTIHQAVSSEPFREGFRTGREQIEWDGTDQYGAYVGKGSYIYKVFVKSANQGTCKGSVTQTEKMILLK